MSSNRCRAVVLVALICVSLITACDDAPKAPSGSNPSASATPAVAVPKLAQLSADMVAAVSAGKTATSVGVHFALGGLPAVGQSLPIKIAIVPHKDFTAISAHFDSAEGLALTSGEIFGPVTGVKSETPLDHALVVVPAQEGVFMITASVESDGEEGNFTRVFTIPVIVGLAASPAAPKAK